jgi:hypothetical protein
VVGVQRTIEAFDQVASGVSHGFASWSDGGAIARAIVTPPVDTTYTATYRTVDASGPPAPPASLTALVNGGTVRLAWNRSAGAQGYRIDGGTAAGQSNLGTFAVGDVDGLESLVPPGVYYVRVRATNLHGVSAPSNEVVVTVSGTASCTSPPPAPTGFTAQTGGLLVAFAWARSPAATSYQIDAGWTAGTTAVVAPVGNVSALQATAGAGTYYTRVRAANACGTSGPSVEVPVTLGCGPGAVVPGNLTLVKAGGVAAFAWLPPLGATSFRVQVGSVPGASDVADTDIGTVTSLAVPLAGVPARTYYVRVVAVSACGVGMPSNEVSLTAP